MHSLFRMVPSSVCGDVVFLFFFFDRKQQFEKSYERVVRCLMSELFS